MPDSPPVGQEQEMTRRILLEAVKDLHRDEPFERALGRALRRHGRGFDDYLSIISQVRERASRDGVDSVEAARRVASDF